MKNIIVSYVTKNGVIVLNRVILALSAGAAIAEVREEGDLRVILSVYSE